MTKVWRSGSAWVATLIAQAIAEQGATIAFVAPRSEPLSREPHHANLTRIVTSRELIGGEPRTIRAIASLRRIAGSLWSVIWLRRNTRNFIFSIPEPLIFTLPLFCLLRLSGAKVIYIAHDSEPHAWNFGGGMRRLERLAHLLSYRLSSVVVALAPSVRDALVRDFGVNSEKISIVPHGPFSIGDVGPVPGSKKLLLFGSLRKNKCVLEVIQGTLLARRRGLSVVLVVAGEPLKQEADYWQQCVDAVASDPTGFDLKIGFLPDEEIPALVRTVDAFVLAYSNFSSQSGVGVMAAIAGRPVIGTMSGGLSELFDRGMVGQIIDGEVTPESVAAALCTFYDRDFRTWQSEASNGASQVAKSLRWDLIADEYIRLARL